MLLLPLIAWAVTFARGRGATRFPAIPWLTGCAAWLGLEIMHPGLNSPLAGIASIVMNLGIMSPAFWVGSTRITSGRLTRLMTLVLLCNAASTAVGVLQFYDQRSSPLRSPWPMSRT